MADPKRPNQNASKDKAEGERWASDPDSVERADENRPAERYEDTDGDNAGGVTNRPFDEEVENQDALPPRGERRGDTTED
jgi:hypothetical protein